MSLAARARTAVVLLALLAVWPYAHRVLVERHHLDPWRYFGFAMYCYPKNDVAVGFFVPVEGSLQMVPRAAVSEDIERGLRRFRTERRTRGSLEPQAIARGLQASLAVPELLVQVRQLHYDVASASFRERVVDYLYRGSDPPSVRPHRTLYPSS
jgi:hypothetical protein